MHFTFTGNDTKGKVLRGPEATDKHDGSLNASWLSRVSCAKRVKGVENIIHFEASASTTTASVASADGSFFG